MRFSILFVFLICMTLTTAMSQIDVFKPGSTYGLTMSYINDLGSSMYRLTGSLKYGPVRLFPWKHRFVYCPLQMEPTACTCENINKDSIEIHNQRFKAKLNALPKIIDSVFVRYPVSLTTFAGYSYIYNAPTSNPLIAQPINIGGVHGGIVFTFNTSSILDCIFNDTSRAAWIDKSGLEFRPYVGVGLTFLTASSIQTKLDRAQLPGVSDTTSMNALLNLPGTVGVDLMAGAAFTLDSQISILLGLSLSTINFSNATLTGTDPTIAQQANVAFGKGELSLIAFDFSRMGLMVGVSINID